MKLKNLKLEDGKTKLQVKKDLYSEKSLHETIQAFKENFEIEKKDNDSYWEIVIYTDEMEIDREKLFLEFFNYLLSKQKEEISLHSL